MPSTPNPLYRAHPVPEEQPKQSFPSHGKVESLVPWSCLRLPWLPCLPWHHPPWQPHVRIRPIPITLPPADGLRSPLGSVLSTFGSSSLRGRVTWTALEEAHRVIQSARTRHMFAQQVCAIISKPGEVPSALPMMIFHEAKTQHVCTSGYKIKWAESRQSDEAPIDAFRDRKTYRGSQ